MAAATTTPAATTFNRHRVDRRRAAVNRLHAAVHAAVTAALLFYRTTSPTDTPLLPWLLMSTTEVFLFSTWLLRRAVHLFPLRRTTAFSEEENEIPRAELPGLDVFVCTADPEKEPVESVMATVLSAMSLCYPAERLRVFISDDGGNPATALAAAEVCSFAGVWLPFCRDHGITGRSPESYFEDQSSAGECGLGCAELRVKEKYEEYKKNVRSIAKGSRRSDNHNALVKVVNPSLDNGLGERSDVPLLVYVSREKRKDQPNNFKAGALNTLLRVSGILSNAPYVLILDCDMRCADPQSAQRAMSYFADPELSPSLGFVQFPQRFGNISSNDIYDSRLRAFFLTEQEGSNGLRGPIFSGSCGFIKRKALYINGKGSHTDEMYRRFGYSDEYIESILGGYKPTCANVIDDDLRLVAAYGYENGTTWGEEVGFVYHSVVEDFSTSFVMHKNGWVSVYCNPKRAQFLGNGVTDLNTMLQQGCRWSTGCIEASFSFLSSPILAAKGMGFLQLFMYLSVAFTPLYFLPLWCLAILPQLCLVTGQPIFPQVSDPRCMLFIFPYVSYMVKEYGDVGLCGGTFGWLVNEERAWMMRCIVCHSYGTIEAFMKVVGLRGATFSPTNKAVAHDSDTLYRLGKYDFRVSPPLLVPIVTLAVTNLLCIIVGVVRVAAFGGVDDLFLQLFWCFVVFVMSYHVLEGAFLRGDIGSVPMPVTIASSLLSVGVVAFGSLLLPP